MTGIERIAAERKRQIEEEGWNEVRDIMEHPDGELARAAACYALPDHIRRGAAIALWWPWDGGWWKPTPDNRIRELEKAGALIAAEIDRLHRLQRIAEPTP